MRSAPTWDQQFFQAGWHRWLPTPAFLLCLAVHDMDLFARGGTLDSQPTASATDVVLGVVGGISAPVDFGEWVDAAAPAVAAARDVQERSERLAREAGFHLGSNRDLLALLLSFGLVISERDGAVLRWRLAQPLPLPEEVASLTEEERREEDGLRWEALFADDARRLLAELNACAPRVTSLGELGFAIDRDPETVRQALTLLVDHGSVAAVGEPERMSDDAALQIDVNPVATA